MILNAKGNNILQHLTGKEYSDFVKLLEFAILSTDLSLFMQRKQQYYVSWTQATKQLFCC